MPGNWADFFEKNMPNSKIDIINTIDLRKSEECKRSYSYTDQYYFVNTAYEQHYLNWLNITILRNKINLRL